ncbi:hypothetical protein ACQKOA_26295 [Bacillus mobilis]|uniref:hypothetical protein n=1 Tax=Bacillus mobilis TaxID=2026190 RepID=UPI003D056EBF
MEEEGAGCLDIIFVLGGISLFVTFGFYLTSWTILIGIALLCGNELTIFSGIYDLLFSTSWWIVLVIYFISAIIVALIYIYNSNKG